MEKGRFVGSGLHMHVFITGTIGRGGNTSRYAFVYRTGEVSEHYYGRLLTFSNVSSDVEFDKQISE